MTKNNKTVQQKMEELSTLVTWFDSDSFKLEDATEKFKEAQNLAQEIETDLNELKNEVEVLQKNFSKE